MGSHTGRNDGRVETALNVILISLDTLRAMSMSLYGYARLTTPHIDRLASAGAVFNQCYSPHIPTHPAHTCMMTGKDVFTTQIICQGGAIDLDQEQKTLAEILQGEGFFTAAADNLGRWFSRGFDEYRGYRWESDPRMPFRKAEAVNAVALELLEKAAAQERPFFLFLHYWDPHTPYKPPEPFKHMFYRKGQKCDANNRSMDPVYDCAPFTAYFRQWMFEVQDSGAPEGGEPVGVEEKLLWTDIDYAIAQYDAEIAYLDATLGQLFTRLHELDLTSRTLLVITADHGEELHEHQLWFDHHGLYDTNLWIPLILHCPGKIPSGKRINGFVRMFDVPVTILDFLGLRNVAKKERMEGASLIPLLKRNLKNRKGTADTLYVTECTWMKKKGVRTHDWKLIVEAGGTPAVYNKPDVELYDLQADPGEKQNIADQRPDVVKELREKLDAWTALRKSRTRKPDPHEYQDITLRQVGKLESAIPRDQKLTNSDATDVPQVDGEEMTEEMVPSPPGRLSPDEERRIAERLSQLGYE